MSTVAEKRITPEEYLAHERAAETKSEYDNGVVYAMSGANEAHNLISIGLTSSLRARLLQRCRVYPSDLRIRLFRPTRYFYADASVVCGESRFDSNERDVLLNPLVLFEILSDSTQAYDRGRKFLGYQSIDSLQEYVLISQKEYQIEHYQRSEAGQWIINVIIGVDSVLTLTSCNCEIPLRDIYYQVELGAQPLDLQT